MSTYWYALGSGILMLGISFFVGKRMGFFKKSENPPKEPRTNRPTKDEIIKDE